MKLEPIPFAKSRSVGEVQILNHLVREKCLQYFDGDLLVLMRGLHGEPWISHWCDCDKEAHRWLLMRTTEEALARFLAGKLSYKVFIPGSCPDRIVYFIDRGREHSSIWELEWSKYPKEYQPGHVFYDEDLAEIS